MLLIHETLNCLTKRKIMAIMDIRQVFYRIQLSEDVEELPTICTCYGSFKFKVIPFGLWNEPASVQRYIDSVLSTLLEDFDTAYIDNILIHCENIKEMRDTSIKLLKLSKLQACRSTLRTPEPSRNG